MWNFCAATWETFISLWSRLKAEAEQQKKEEEKARREYIRDEYLRKKQLQLMVDMDEVIKPRSGSLKKKPRPKSIHRDVLESSTPPVRAAGTGHKLHTLQQAVSVLQQPLTRSCCVAGVRPRGYSVSSVSLASLNLADNDREPPNNRKYNRSV